VVPAVIAREDEGLLVRPGPDLGLDPGRSEDVPGVAEAEAHPGGGLEPLAVLVAGEARQGLADVLLEVEGNDHVFVGRRGRRRALMRVERRGEARLEPVLPGRDDDVLGLGLAVAGSGPPRISETRISVGGRPFPRWRFMCSASASMMCAQSRSSGSQRSAVARVAWIFPRKPCFTSIGSFPEWSMCAWDWTTAVTSPGSKPKVEFFR
jgi:hypothetical protein